MEYERKIAEIVADAADIDPAAVAPEANLYAELGLDSLGAVAVFVGLRAAFGTPEPRSAEQAILLDTPRKLLDYVVSHRFSNELT